MIKSSFPAAYYRLTPHSIEDHAHWRTSGVQDARAAVDWAVSALRVRCQRMCSGSADSSHAIRCTSVDTIPNHFLNFYTMNPSPTSYYRITPHSIEDRAHWLSLRENPRHAALFERMEALCA